MKITHGLFCLMVHTHTHTHLCTLCAIYSICAMCNMLAIIKWYIHCPCIVYGGYIAHSSHMDSVAKMIQSVMTPITHWMLITWFILNRGYWINWKHSMRLLVAILIWIDFMNCHWNDDEKQTTNSLLKKG